MTSGLSILILLIVVLWYLCLIPACKQKQHLCLQLDDLPAWEEEQETTNW